MFRLLVFTLTHSILSDCPELTLIARGKVRDLYEVDESTLLFVATDRISAFDVIMKNVSVRRMTGCLTDGLKVVAS